nr:MAG TPA: hypothetical protein [Caudoviricetes sp.]
MFFLVLFLTKKKYILYLLLVYSAFCIRKQVHLWICPISNFLSF